MQLGINPNLRELIIQPFKGDLSKVFNHLDALGWTDVNTRSSKNGDWSMLSLRGYSSDPRKCGKPAEECGPRVQAGDTVFTGPNVALDTKFVKEKVYEGYEFEIEYLHEGGTLQDCSIRNGDVFRIVEEILEPLPCEFQRIRFAKLLPGAFLEPHTDAIDQSFGLQDGEIARIAVPLQTNDKATFSVYPQGKDGPERKMHLNLGHYYYTDVKGWHSIENKGDTDRVHLLIDCISNKEFRRLLVQ
tara:strand:- start:2027 stop:2758 length:732 start_codon:yes stop_codon:yes gene_type:complete